jgi:hypothetical protein
MLHQSLGFNFWLKAMIGQVESSALPTSRILGRVSDILQDPSDINGEDIFLKDAIDEFVQVHDSAAYPVRGILRGEATSPNEGRHRIAKL